MSLTNTLPAPVALPTLLPRPARILLADDDPLTRRIVRATLAADGYGIVEATSGREAVERFRASAPDLVLLDVRMSDGDGFDACRQMRAIDPEETVPILMLTASDDVQSIEEAFPARATDFVVKPFRHRLLLQRVRYALRSRGLDREVRRSRRRQAVALHMARVTFWEWDPVSDLMTWPADALPLEREPVPAPPSGGVLLAMLEMEDADRLSRAVAHARAHREAFDLELRLRAGQQVIRMVGGPGEPDADHVTLSGALQDITALRRSEALAEYLAMHDELTGLGNRRRFTERLDELLATRRDMPITDDARPGVVLVGWFDITRFQRVNDALGEHAGNLLLTRVGRRIRAFVPPTHLVGRVGGDEFAVALYAADAEWARRQFHSLLFHLREPVAQSGDELTLAWSAGYTIAPVNDADASTLLAAAEGAQRRARATGSLCESAAPDALQPERAALILERERALRHAIHHGGMRLVAQPQVEARTGRVIGVETLVRWRDALGREVPPEEFIPLLEENGLIEQLGTWSLAQACEWQRRWSDQGMDLRVAVNLSPRQFNDPLLVERIGAVLAQARVPAGRIELELTESVAMQRPDHAVELLAALRRLGVKVALDDFGVGHSSLAHLARFPLDTIKLDRAFSVGLTQSRQMESVVRAAVGIAEGLGLTMIAEGVETAAQAERLAALGVSELQGFHIARPMPPEDLKVWMDQRSHPGREALAGASA